MEVWRKKGDKFNQEFSRTKSNYNHHYKKPPIGATNWQQNVPYWEKRFVYSVGSLSWKKFMEAKKFTHLYDNIMNWDDSAGETAFKTAKDRFYAQFHGLPCEVDQHNPDLYIDQIDWNSEMDQNLILDLDSEPVVTDVNSQHEPVVIFGDVLPDPYKDLSAYGWGDSDEKLKKSCGNSDGLKGDQNGINWDDYIDNGKIIWDGNVGGVNNDLWVWNETDDRAGDQGWNTNTYDDNNNYYSSYGNGNSHKTRYSYGNNDQKTRSWRNNGNRRSTSQRGHGSTFQAHGSQRIHVHP